MNARLVESVPPPPIVEFKAKAAKVASLAERTFDMSQAVPNLPTPVRLRRRLADALVSDGELSFYTDVPGREDLRTRIAASHPLAASLCADDLLITAGANNAMFSAFVLHFQAGDRVVLLEPFYFNYDMGLRMLGVDPLYCPLKPEDGFSLNVDDLVAFLEIERPRGVVVITPNNPTGATYAPEALLKLLRWTSPRGIEIIIDETYARYDPGHLRHLAIGEFVGRGLTLVGSFSKTYSLTGYRVGYLAAGRREMAEALKIQDTALICAPHVSQLAALIGLEECESELQEQLACTERLRARLRELAGNLKAFSLVSSGAFFAYLRHPHFGISCDDAALDLYRRAGILGLPGTTFGQRQGQFIRLALCNLLPDELEAAMAQLARYDTEVWRG